MHHDKLEFLWLELTYRCNLSCVHCYSDSSPMVSIVNDLADRENIGILECAAELGCRRIQFIGGEPTLVQSLPDLIDLARARGFK